MKVQICICISQMHGNAVSDFMNQMNSKICCLDGIELPGIRPLLSQLNCLSCTIAFQAGHAAALPSAAHSPHHRQGTAAGHSQGRTQVFPPCNEAGHKESILCLVSSASIHFLPQVQNDLFHAEPEVFLLSKEHIYGRMPCSFNASFPQLAVERGVLCHED